MLKLMNNQEQEVNYDLSFLKSPKWLSIYLGFGLLLILSNLNLEAKLDKLVYSSLKVTRSCQIQIKDYEVNFFPLPHLQLNRVNVPGSCMGHRKPSIFLPELSAYFRGPSFSPFGILFKLETQLESIPVEVYITAGISTIAIVLKESTIPLDKISKFLPQVQLGGSAKIDLYVELKKLQLSKVNLNLRSNSFVIPPQMVIPMPLNIQDLQLIATGDMKSVKIEKFVLGNETSPVRSSFQGVVKLVPRNILASGLNLKGELALSEELNDSFSFFLQKYDKKDNFYQIQIAGTLGAPKL